MKRYLVAIGVCLWVLAAKAQPVTFTHYVTPDGSATGGCTQEVPCSLTRAFTVNVVPRGSVVQVAAGIYSHAAVTLKANGVRYVGEGEARIVGTKDKPPAWTLAAGQTYTYEAPVAYTVSNVAQRPPVPTWRPIIVDDKASPTGPSQGRPLDLNFPIRYTQRATVAEVERQSCTFASSAGKVYVHPCHDGPPADADNFYVAPYGWGALVIEGDDDSLEHIEIEQVAGQSGTALKVQPSADRPVLKNITARASQVWLEGKQTDAQDLEVGYVIAQGTFPSSDCADANPDFGIGECWQGAGKGDALLIGRQGSTLFYNQHIKRAKIHRSWNGGRLDGYNTIEDSSFWGFPNHALQISGGGATLKSTVILNAQDSVYMEGNAFNALTLLHNIFVNGVLVWASRDGRPIGQAPTVWTMRHNVLPAIVLDDRTYPVGKMDCNVYIPSSPAPSHLLKISSTSGAASVTYKTLAQVKASTPLEANSVERPSSWWRAGPMFLNFTDPKQPTFDFSDPLSVCGERAGPQAVAQ